MAISKPEVILKSSGKVEPYEILAIDISENIWAGLWRIRPEEAGFSR